MSGSAISEVVRDMAEGAFRFHDFLLDPGDRQLRRGGETVELNGRYFDALALLVREQGKLVSKDRFLDEVWRGVPVTDEALTQCIRTLRRQLGDSVGRPQFIETVPKYGYRFIAPVESVGDGVEVVRPILPRASSSSYPRNELLLLTAGGSAGGLVAGAVGGLFYGLAGASQPLQPGPGATSVLIVLVCLSMLVSMLGGFGVSAGIAAAVASKRSWPGILGGGALGGLAVGAFVSLVGADAFSLLFGRSPGDVTGAFEGLLLGTAVGLGATAAFTGRPALRRGSSAAAAAAGTTGVAIVLMGGQMWAGTLTSISRNFPGSRLNFDGIGRQFGESGFGPISQLATSALEGALFGGCVVAGMVLARRSFGPKRSHS